MAAHVLGRWDDAERHLDEALRRNRRAGAPLLVAHTLRSYASMLTERYGPGDRDRADEITAEATALYDELGLDGWMAVVRTVPETVVTTPDHPVFRRAGEVWELIYDGTRGVVKDAKGMHDLARLLARPGQETHVLDLVAATSVGPDRAAARPAGESVPAVPGGLGPVLDDRARREYRARLAELESDLAEAERFGDSAAAERARRERSAIAAELATAYGIGGRARIAGNPVERARQAVKWRVREAIRRIEAVHPPLGRHLANAIRTGTYCSYSPERPITWEL
jgi:hypothetical protein